MQSAAVEPFQHYSKGDASLILVTQVFDPADPVLGVVCRWAEALNRRCSRLTVIANSATTVNPDGIRVFSLGKEKGLGRVRRTVRYLQLVEEVAREEGRCALLAHMCPDYLTLARPTTKRHHMPSFLWYAHPSYTCRLRMAERLADGILTSLPGAYPGHHPRIHVIGQATDVRAMPLAPPVEPRVPLRLLAIGRTSPSKGYQTILEGFRLARAAGLEAILRIVGPSTTPAERRYRGQLRQQILSSGLDPYVALEGGVSFRQIRELLRSSHALVNATVAGSADKVVFEAMAAGRPVVVSNPLFNSLLAGPGPKLSFPQGDAAQLADALKMLAGMGTVELTTLGHELRERVKENHSLETWCERVVSIVLDSYGAVSPS